MSLPDGERRKVVDLEYSEILIKQLFNNHFRCFHYLFEMKENHSDQFTIKASYLEVYNEKVCQIFVLKCLESCT